LESGFGNVSVVVAREMTKVYESIYRGTPLEVKEKLLKDPVKGEIVVVVEAKK
jgi:16S rRNA (cytidine1402-2'-O)-methyltransferase